MDTSVNDLVTTTEAAALTGRTQDVIRRMINFGYITASSENGRWYIDRQVLDAWDRRAKRRPTPARPPAWQRSAEIIAEYGSVSAEELADLADIHIGNARKHLALMAKHGRARRRPDGQWVLTVESQQGGCLATG